MRTRLYQAVAVAAVLTAGAAASSPALVPTSMRRLRRDARVPSQDVFEGWYLGGTIGGASVSYDVSPAADVSTSGVLGGVIGGYSWQHGPFVIGVEGDFMATDIDGSSKYNGGLNKVSPGIDTMADLRFRAGYAITPRVLLFGTFGGAWANADLPIRGPGGGGEAHDSSAGAPAAAPRWRSTRIGAPASTTSSPISIPRRSTIPAAR